MKPLLLLLLSCSPLLLSQKTGRPAPSEPKPDPDWVLTFADEFNGTELDLTRWAPHDPRAYAPDRQLQAYAPESLSVSGGQLHIIARRARANGDTKQREYVSGIIGTFGTFSQTYGRFEIRCRVPAGRGLKPSFLLLPVPIGPLPEIEVFETIGSSPSKIYFANRWGTAQTERSFGDSFAGPDLSTGFHTVSVEWDREKIIWLIDGKEKFQSVEGVPRQPMYLLLDLAVGGSVGANLAPAPDASTAFPASFDIDYIRVYQRP